MTRGKKQSGTAGKLKHGAITSGGGHVCERCGRLMVDVLVPTLVDEGGPRHTMGWRCATCGHVIDAHSLGHHPHGDLGEEEQRR